MKNPFIDEQEVHVDREEQFESKERGFNVRGQARSDIGGSVNKRVGQAKPLFSELIYLIKTTLSMLFKSQTFKMFAIGGCIGLILAAAVKIVPLHIGFAIGAGLNTIMSWGRDLSNRNNVPQQNRNGHGNFFR